MVVDGAAMQAIEQRALANRKKLPVDDTISKLWLAIAQAAPRTRHHHHLRSTR